MLFYPHQIWTGLKCAFSANNRRRFQTDVHNRLMLAYPEVPQWWYGIVWAISFIMAAVTLAKYLPEAPVWVDRCNPTSSISC